VTTVRACLVDVYETLIAYDFQARFSMIAAMAGVDPADLRRAQQRHRADLDTGALSTAAAFSMMPFLAELKSLGIKIALVSNCPDNARTMLSDLGLIELADHVTLSCEIGYLKPSPEIYAHALAGLQTLPEHAVMVDDQSEYCSGAEAAGPHAIRIVRGGPPANSGFQSARSLRDALQLL
jgi:HAD superfamily hydrolase (TIGR01509 family)